MRLLTFALVFALLGLGLGCGAAASAGQGQISSAADEEVLAAWEAWRTARHDSLAGEEGWLSLVALGWLDAPSTTVGSEPGSQISLPADHAPARLGRLELRDGAAWLVPGPGGTITGDDAPGTGELALTPHEPGPPPRPAGGPLRMHVIARAGRLGLRVKDRESAARLGFHGPEVFPYDASFRVPARFEPAGEGETLPITNVLGQQVEEPLAGRLRFALGGVERTLLATWAGTTPEEGLSLMVRDATSDEGTSYGAGRYLEVDAPDASGRTSIDFNFAYTPPCGYTDFATCPLPPSDNELAVAITAGERAPEGH